MQVSTTGSFFSKPAGDTFEFDGNALKPVAPTRVRETSRGPVVTTQEMVTDDMDKFLVYREEWAIRSEDSKSCLGYEERSQTKWKWVGFQSCLRYSRAFRETEGVKYTA
jgi:hypothetical protein